MQSPSDECGRCGGNSRIFNHNQFTEHRISGEIHKPTCRHLPLSRRIVGRVHIEDLLTGFFVRFETSRCGRRLIVAHFVLSRIQIERG